MISSSRPAVFLDRDGVLIDDVDLLVEPRQARVLDGVPQALSTLRDAGFALVVVTNQPVIARGMASEDQVRRVHRHLDEQFASQGASVDAWYYCPHHPRATVDAYRVDCECRKPSSGMLLEASRTLAIDLSRSFLVGDRVTDIAAGASAGCRTILVKTGQHEAPPIQTSKPFDANVRAEHECSTLLEASQWITSRRAA